MKNKNEFNYCYKDFLIKETSRFTNYEFKLSEPMIKGFNKILFVQRGKKYRFDMITESDLMYFEIIQMNTPFPFRKR